MSSERQQDEGPPDLVPAEAAVRETAVEAGEPPAPSGLALAEPETPPPAAAPLDELEALRQERDQLKEQLLRRRADFENYRRRVERDRQQAARFRTVEVAAD